MSNICNDILPERQEHLNRMQEVRDLWDSKKLMVQMYGKAETDLGREMVTYFAEDVLKNGKKPYHEHFILSEPEIQRIKNAIDSQEKQIAKGSVGWIRRNTLVVPHAVARKSPATGKFMDNLDLGKNYERTQSNKQVQASRVIAMHMRKAHIDEARKDRKLKQTKYLPGVDVLRDIDELQYKIQSSTNASEVFKYEKAVEELIAGDKGRLVRQFMDLMQMNQKDFRNIKANRGEYNQDIIQAAESGKVLMREMAPVMTAGLRNARDVVSLRIIGERYNENNPQSSLLTNPYAKSTIRALNDAIDRVNVGKKGRDYMPHLILDDLVRVKHDFDNFAAIKQTKDQNKALADMSQTLDGILQHQGSQPETARARNDLIENYWNKNPLFILQQYSQDVIGFNHVNKIQGDYLEVMKSFGKSGVDTKFVTGMREWINDEFMIATRGLKDRPDWMNNTVRLITAAETIKAMGLSVTGTIRNAVSAMYFFTDVGFLNAKRAMHEYNNDGIKVIDRDGNTSTISQRLDRVESEQGFKFGDIGAELYAEGLLPATGINQSDVRFNQLTGNVEYRENKSWRVMNKGIDWSVSKALTFHRITENWSRNYMFRTAYIMAEQQYRSQPGYAESMGEAALSRKATNVALKAVNMFAYEYAAHAKPRLMSGYPGKIDPKTGKIIQDPKAALGAAGQLTFQLLHYPLSFLDMQYQILKGSKDSMLAGQWDSPENMYVLKYAGLAFAIQALSVTLNADLNTIAENDTWKKIMSIKDHFEEDSEKTRRGLLSEVTGPFPGDVQYALMMSGLMELPDSDFGKIILGYEDYANKTGDEQKADFFNKIGTEVGRWHSKILPAVRDGRGTDTFRHWLAMYPRDWTKDYHEKLWGKKRKRYPKHIALARKKAGLSLRYEDPSGGMKDALDSLDLLDK
jgi:hypothetical protein